MRMCCRTGGGPVRYYDETKPELYSNGVLSPTQHVTKRNHFKQLRNTTHPFMTSQALQDFCKEIESKPDLCS